MGVVLKKGSWYSYQDKNLAQGRDKVLAILASDPELARSARPVCPCGCVGSVCSIGPLPSPASMTWLVHQDGRGSCMTELFLAAAAAAR